MSYKLFHDTSYCTVYGTALTSDRMCYVCILPLLWFPVNLWALGNLLEDLPGWLSEFQQVPTSDGCYAELLTLWALLASSSVGGLDGSSSSKKKTLHISWDISFKIKCQSQSRWTFLKLMGIRISPGRLLGPTHAYWVKVYQGGA